MNKVNEKGQYGRHQILSTTILLLTICYTQENAITTRIIVIFAIDFLSFIYLPPATWMFQHFTVSQIAIQKICRLIKEISQSSIANVLLLH